MKFSFAPKYVASAAWLSAAVLLAAAAWIYPGAGFASLRRAPASEPQLASLEATRLQNAVDFLQQLKEQQALVSPVASGEFPAGRPGAAGFQFVAPSPPVARKAAIPADGMSGSTGSASGSSLIFIQSAKRSLAVVDGQPVRVGQSLAGGELVERIGKTFVVLRDPAGATRILDMQNRFSPSSAAVVRMTDTSAMNDRGGAPNPLQEKNK